MKCLDVIRWNSLASYQIPGGNGVRKENHAKSRWRNCSHRVDVVLRGDGGNGVNITFPTLMHEFKIATNTVQWMTTLYLLVVAAMVPLSATLKRRFKTRSLFLVAISLFITGVVLDGVAPAFWVLLLGRGVQGLGTGIELGLLWRVTRRR